MIFFWNWNHFDLPRRNPEWPFPTSLLWNDGNNSLQWTQNGSMNHHWPLESSFKAIFMLRMMVILVGMLILIFLLIFLRIQLSFWSSILEIESLRQDKIYLNCAQLMLSLESILSFYIYFRTIKCTITMVNSPFFAKLFQSTHQCTFSLLPQTIITYWKYWSWNYLP